HLGYDCGSSNAPPKVWLVIDGQTGAAVRCRFRGCAAVPEEAVGVTQRAVHEGRSFLLAKARGSQAISPAFPSPCPARALATLVASRSASPRAAACCSSRLRDGYRCALTSPFAPFAST